jgi:hypothetical protein
MFWRREPGRRLVSQFFESAFLESQWKDRVDGMKIVFSALVNDTK